MKRIYKAENITEAHIVSGMLNANGIDTHVGGHYLQGGIGELAAMDFACVYVDDDDAERARKLIEEYEGIDTPDREPQHETNPWTTILKFILIVATLLLIYTVAFAIQ